LHFTAVATGDCGIVKASRQVASTRCTSTALLLGTRVTVRFTEDVALFQCTSTALLPGRNIRKLEITGLHFSSALRLHCHSPTQWNTSKPSWLHLSSALRLHCYSGDLTDNRGVIRCTCPVHFDCIATSFRQCCFASFGCCTCPVHFDCIATPRYCNHFVLNKPQNVFREPRHFALF
jgi:predicted DNA-binding ribbon-helix-helix protein